MPEPTSILVIDDEEAICFAFRRYFEKRGLRVAVAATAREGLARLRETGADVIFLDVRLPDADGLDVLERIRAEDPRAAVIVITAYGSLETVTRALRNQAFEYLVKPLDLDRAAELVDRAVASRAAGEPAPAEPDRADPRDRTVLVGSSPAMQDVYKRIGKVAQSDAAVLICGDTGTGKELVARAIHEHSPRRARPFVAVNCGALPENLVESELFGYVRGAFSGADADKPGRFEAADGGTLFLDEVAELPLAAQVKLLRFLDSQTVERLGSIRSIRLDVRVLAATNRDPRAAVESGALRADLFFRLAVVQIELPRLTQRVADIVPLAEHFLAAQAGRTGQPIRLSDEAAEVLKRYAWPGNVRELRNAAEHAAIVSGGGVILPAHLPETVRAGGAAWGAGPTERAAETYLDAVAAGGEGLHAAAVGPVERAVILRALRAAGGNQSAAAKALGLHRNTLRRKLRELGLGNEAAH
jgi:DNA-binding NtrC family response regulator